MSDPLVLIVLGTLFSVGLLADQLGRRTPIPRVTLLLLFGLVVGALDLLPTGVTELTETVTATALTFVAILLGGSLKVETLKAHGVEILVISIAIVLTTLLGVAAGLTLWGVEFALALVLAGIATATDPAATLDVIRQSRVANNFSEIMKGIVAIDDAWGLLAFSLCLAVATHISGAAEDVTSSVLYDITGAIGLGFAIGIPAAFLTGRIEHGEPLQIEGLALCFLTAGAAIWLGVSFILAGMVVGALIVNVAPHHTKAFHEIEHVQWPFLIIFFVLAGASLELETIAQLGVVGLVLILLRIATRLLGGILGATIVGAPPGDAPLYGIALLPQAGVAIGMALVAAQAMPQWREQIVGLTVGATVVFEIIGPFATLWAVRRSH